MSNTCNCHNNSSSGPVQQKFDYSEMQALTAVLNPDTVNRGDNKSKVIIYQSLSSNGTLGFEQSVFAERSVRKQGEGQGVFGNYGQPSPFSPVLKFGSTLVSMVVDNIVHVYGVTAHDNAICLLSPVYQPWKNAKTDANLQGKIGGCTDGKGKGWIYFQKAEGNERGAIFEKNLMKPNDQPVRLDKTEKAKLGTDIVAFYDGKRRWIAYQTWTTAKHSKSELELICGDDKNTMHTIDGTSSFIDKEMTELAATTALNDKNGKKLMYIYFRDQDSVVRWCSAEVPSGGSPNFSAPAKLDASVGLETLEPRSSLSVLPDKEGIVIYAIQEDGDKIEAFFDEFSAKASA